MKAPTIDFSTARWRKATASDHQGDCVEVARVDGHIGVRDSKNRADGMLAFCAAAFAAFAAGVRAGDFE